MPHEHQHHHDHQQQEPGAAHLDHAPDQSYWDALYSASDRIWSGRANPQLIAAATDLAPGRALDVGSGEGGDATWLAARGWSVTAVDLSEVALARAQASAEAAGLPAGAAARIDWQHRDVLAWAPGPASYDLVSSQYSHFPSSDMVPLVGRLAAAVAPGGHLLVVGHEATEHHAIGPDFFFVAADLAASLDSAEWEVVTAEPLPHPHRDGRDEVLHVRRRP